MSDAPVRLLIDHIEEHRQFYTERLTISSPDFQIVHAATGQEGLSYCKWQLVDCVVLEIALPDVSGMEVLVKLVPRSWHPDIPVIVLTGIANRFLWDAALKNGALAALYKPMTSGDMLDKAILKAMAAIPREGKRPMLPARASANNDPMHCRQCDGVLPSLDDGRCGDSGVSQLRSPLVYTRLTIWLIAHEQSSWGSMDRELKSVALSDHS